jgi:DNA-binding response OmpR family regulator
MLMREVFEMDGFKVSTAKNGYEAFDHIQSSQIFDYVFLDLTIPGHSSEEVIRLINKHPSREKMNVIIASGWDDLKSRSESLGADQFLRKPIDLDQLQDILK